MRHSVVRNTFIYLFNIGTVSVLNIITIPIFTAYLSPYDYGMIALNAVATGVATIIGGWGLDNFANRLEIKYFNDAKKRAKCLGWVFVTNLVIAVLVCCVLSLLPHLFYRFIYQGARLPYFYLYLIPVWTVLTQRIIVFYQHYQINLQQASSYSRLNIALQLSNFAILIPGFLLFHFSLTGYMVSMFAVQLFYAGLIVFFWIPKILEFDARYRRYIRLGFRYGLPLHFEGYIAAIQNYLDRLLIAGKLNINTLGIYSFSFTFSNNYSLTTQAMNNSLNPEVYRRLDQKTDDDNNLAYLYGVCLFYFMALALIGFAFSLFSKEIIILLTNERFHSSYEIVPVIIVSLIFLDMNSIYNATRVFIKNKTRFMTLASFSSVFFKAILLFALIPLMGVWGAVIAFLLFHVFNFAIYKLYADRILPMKTPSFLSVIILLGYSFLYFIVQYICPFKGLLPVILLKALLLTVVVIGTLVFLKRSDSVLFGKMVAPIQKIVPRWLMPGV
ncbi:MAG TPA: lipopolysaccharide biosynthesis protein [Syntrophorhabdaceae bacterium]|nr:lipopolysaccharide biosynthesis protein [Syntrophorhabdaceae bacterium]